MFGSPDRQNSGATQILVPPSQGRCDGRHENHAHDYELSTLKHARLSSPDLRAAKSLVYLDVPASLHGALAEHSSPGSPNPIKAASRILTGGDLEYNDA
jgi:hypothetical protein